MDSRATVVIVMCILLAFTAWGMVENYSRHPPTPAPIERWELTCIYGLLYDTKYLDTGETATTRAIETIPRMFSETEQFSC
jgi:hypothetical protein